jgi:uncharacterized protein (DUF2267 family)
MTNYLASNATCQATSSVVSAAVSQPAPPASPLRLQVACNIAWRSGKAGRTLDETMAAVRRFLRAEPDESFDPQFPNELRAAWCRGQSMLRSAEEHYRRYARFVQQYGDQVYELEALAPELLQKLLTDAIDSVIDHRAFNHELDAEKQDAAFLANKRNLARAALSEIG